MKGMPPRKEGAPNLSFSSEIIRYHQDGSVQLFVEFRFRKDNSVIENFFFVSDEEPQMVEHFLTVI